MSEKNKNTILNFLNRLLSYHIQFTTKTIFLTWFILKTQQIITIKNLLEKSSNLLSFLETARICPCVAVFFFHVAGEG